MGNEKRCGGLGTGGSDKKIQKCPDSLEYDRNMSKGISENWNWQNRLSTTTTTTPMSVLVMAIHISIYEWYNYPAPKMKASLALSTHAWYSFSSIWFDRLWVAFGDARVFRPKSKYFAAAVYVSAITLSGSLAQFAVYFLCIDWKANKNSQTYTHTHTHNCVLQKATTANTHPVQRLCNVTSCTCRTTSNT